ncbi:hypothetical protein SRRS_39680 [Sporomusa rhizae]|uniref:hypothetical protein n=1 Tax=Sporomusa rhizae TaxID=357999 RepID=UPI00352AE0B3
MEIRILDKVYKCENQIVAAESVFSQINELLANANVNISSIEIDDIELYCDYNQYLLEHIEDIKTIVVNVRTLKELMDDTLISIQEYLIRAIPEIDNMVNEFYQEVTQNTWDKFGQLLEGLQYITNTLTTISDNNEWYYNASQFEIVRKNILKQIILLQEAMELQDRVKLSDVLLYEIIPSFKALDKEISLNTEYGKVQ